MADPLLHIKDSYYFEVPKALWPSNRESIGDFPSHWVRNDPHFRKWEAKQIHEALVEATGDSDLVLDWDALAAEYEHWQHEDHANFGKPFDVFLEEKYDTVPPAEQGEEVAAGTWYDQLQGNTAEEAVAFKQKLHEAIESRDISIRSYTKDNPDWSRDKIEAYNKHLSGKVLIPQPFAELNNLYEAQSGFAISKFMVIELIIAGLLLFVFTRLASRIKDGAQPRGTFMNLMETFLVFLRDQVARPAIGGKEADKFVPYIWTIFFFVLGCNLFGLLPWLGAPTGTFSVTTALALSTFGVVLIGGSKKFGIVGFWKNQVPSMDLPLLLAIPLIPMLWLIEVVGLLIKHAVLAIRLLANMVAGHLVLLSIMGLAVTAATYGGTAEYWVTAPIAVIGSTLFNLLELFVAFLQAYIFAFLSALFIGAAVHHH